MAKNCTSALKRVLKRKKKNPMTGKVEPVMEGVFFTNEQLITMGTQLRNTPNGPDGVCFMIGKRDKFVNTVDIIPFSNDFTPSKRTIKLYEYNEIIGNILVHLGQAHIGIGGFSITNEGHSDDNGGPFMPIAGKKEAIMTLGGSQRTPPPFPE